MNQRRIGGVEMSDGVCVVGPGERGHQGIIIVGVGSQLSLVREVAARLNMEVVERDQLPGILPLEDMAIADVPALPEATALARMYEEMQEFEKGAAVVKGREVEKLLPGKAGYRARKEFWR